MILTLPDTRQKTDHDCGVAAVACVLRFWGVGRRVDLDIANPTQGTGPDTVAALLRAAGLVVLSGSMVFADLQHFTRSGRPVLCPVQADGEGHWVVVAGVEHGRVTFHCPLDGLTVVSRAAWLADWYDADLHGTPYIRWGIVGYPEATL